MILASFIGIFAIPSLYVTFQAIREKLRPAARPEAQQKSAGEIRPKRETPAAAE
jgi:hypothetical protein